MGLPPKTSKKKKFEQLAAARVARFRAWVEAFDARNGSMHAIEQDIAPDKPGWHADEALPQNRASAHANCE